MAPLVHLDPGALFARDFRVIHPLSEGGMGAVYVVEQMSTGKERALKIMAPQLVADPKARERFAQEARVGGQIKGDHVVEVVGAGIDDATKTPWLAMELLEGEDLAATMRRRGTLPASEVLEIVEQLSDALGQAHALGIVHRDLKPENLFVAVSRRRGVPFTIKILDFGIAKLVQENKTAATVTSAIGSPFWMAPEQAQRGAKVRPSTDIWALGLIVFHLLTGRYYWHNANAPHDEFNLSALIVEVMTQPIESASARAAALGVAELLPTGFDAWFARCVDRSPTGRIPNAHDAFAELAQALSDDMRAVPPTRPLIAATVPALPPVVLAPGTVSNPSIRRVQPREQTRGWWKVTAALGGVVLVAGGIVDAALSALNNGPREPPVSIVVPPTARPITPSAPPPPEPTPRPVVLPGPVQAPPPQVREPTPVVAPALNVRESTTAVLAEGVVETRHLVWTSTPTPYCFDRDEVTDIASWNCDGFYFSDQGNAEIVRDREGVVVERFPLGPVFNQGDDASPGRPTFARWVVTDDDLAALRASSRGTSPTARLAGRPMARVLALADYDGDGIAAEFVLHVASSSSGHRSAVLVGLGGNGRLRVYGNRGRRTEPVVLAFPSQWETVRGGRSARLVEWECGNHGAEQEEAILLRWERGELVTVQQNRACP